MKIKKNEVTRLHEIIYGTEFKNIEGASEIKSLLNKICGRHLNKKPKTKTIKEKPLSWTGVVDGIHTDFCAKDTKENREMLNSLVKKYGGSFSESIIDLLHLQHLESVEANIRKEHESMVAASTDKSTEFNGGLRTYLVDSPGWTPVEFGGSDFTKTVDASTEPKIGDVGYFNLGSPNAPIVYGRMRNFTGNNYQDTHGNWYVGFSKTPPELK